MTEKIRLAPSGDQPHLASRMTDQGDHTQFQHRNLNHVTRNNSIMSGTDSHIYGDATAICVISGIGIIVFIILLVIVILIHKRWRRKGSVNLKYLSNLSCLKPSDSKEVINLKNLMRRNQPVNCCVTANRHSQPNAYMETKLTNNDSRASDISKRKSNESSTQQEYCYIDIGQSDNRERLSSMTPSTIYEDIDCAASPIDHCNRFFQRVTMFDNKNVIEVMENDIYEASEEGDDRAEKIVVENDIYDSYNNADCYGTSIPENHVYEEVGVGTSGL